MKSVIRAVLALTLLLSTGLVGASPAMAQTTTISGTVSINSGQGELDQFHIEAFDAATEDFVGEAMTNATGFYSIPVDAGSYKLRVTYVGATDDYVGQWWNGKSTRALADIVNGGDTANFAMVEGSRINGDITNTNGTGLDMCVGVFEIVDGNLRLKGSARSGTDGTYAARNVAKGPVVVRFNHCVGQTPVYATEWWDNKATGFTADVFTLAVGVAATGKDAVMGVGGNIAGTVTRESNGNAISGALVRVYQGSTVVASDTTDSGGDYQVNDLPTGTYQVRFSASGFAVEWYNGKTTQSTATNVTLTNGVTKDNINATMQVPDDDGDGDGGGGGGGGGAGSIAGTVTSITGSAVSGAEVEVYKTSGNSAGSLVKSDTTSSSGAYKVSGLADGTYLVLFANESASYFADWYEDAPLYREADATKVTVNGAETGKNGSLQPIFSDIAGSTFYSDIIWLRNTGITLGCDDTHFCPSSSVTRGQMAAFLVRGLDLTGDTSGDTFSDDNGSTFEDEIEILAQAGITLGCADGLFCPEASVTRGQMAAFLVRAMGYDNNPPGDRFTDDNGSTFEDEIEKLAEAGVTQGCTDTQFCPNDPVTRGQMAAFLHRALGGDVIYPG